MRKNWLELLAEAVAASNRTEVARELGISRPAVSLLLLGRYPGSTDRMAARILQRYARVDCPHTGKSVTPDHCRKFFGPVPSSSPAALRQWRACRACPHTPKPATKEDASC